MKESVKDPLHGRSETARLFIDLASTNVDVQDMQYETVNVIESISLFIGEDSEPKNFFFQHSIFTRCNPKRKKRRKTQIDIKLSNCF